MCVITVSFIDGFLRAVSCGCHGCDYVPYYGASEFDHTEQTIEESLIKHFDDISRDPQREKFLKIENLQVSRNGDWSDSFNRLLEKWICSKSSFETELIEQYKDDLSEQIEIVMGKIQYWFYANIQHQEFEYGNDTIGFVGSEKSFYIHFSHSD